MIDFKDDSKYTMEITQENYQFFANYCYEVQRQCQEQVCNLIEKYVNETGIKKFALLVGMV